MIGRSVYRDTLAMSMGMERVLNEIQYWESKPKKVKSVKNRLERLYQARTSLTENPKAAKSLVDQLREINNE
jgi:DNA mismatch repair ATPase MutS|tara:strand:+ start:424 stop:639 length:216 start_codon:yes stop_codon:yes gene_type:complete